MQLDAMMAEAPKELVSCSSVEVVSEGGTVDGSADLCLHPVEVRQFSFCVLLLQAFATRPTLCAPALPRPPDALCGFWGVR